jgi:hypothetical protein
LCNRDCTLGADSKEFILAVFKARQFFISWRYAVTEEFYDLFKGNCDTVKTDREPFKITTVGTEFKCTGKF